MKAIGGFILTVVIVLAVVAGAGFFLLPKTASKTETIQLAKPAASVYALLASSGASETIADGTTQTLKAATPPDTVVYDVAYADGSKGSATYKVVSKGDAASEVAVKLEKPLGDAPMDRLSGLSGKPVEPFLTSAATKLQADASTLNGVPFGDLQYEIVTLEPQNYIYGEGEAPQNASEIKEAVAQVLGVVDDVIARTGARIEGAPIAVETKWENNKYEFNAGWRISSPPPKIYVRGFHAGKSPGGPAIHVSYKGDEANVLPTYYKMEDLVRAARLKLGPSFEVYNDDPKKPGGSVDREIYYMFEGDVSQLTKILPPATMQPLALPAPSTAPAAP